jgi:hypothetical protein
LAHPKCNNSKRDYLAAEKHLENWTVRNDRHLITLNDFFNDSGIIHDLNSSTQITCWAYEQAENAKAHVWVQNNETREIGSYWKYLFTNGSEQLPRAAE